MFYWSYPSHRPAALPETPAASAAEHGTLHTDVYVRGYEPAFWVWDGTRWSRATLLARYWKPGRRSRLRLRVHGGDQSGQRLYVAGDPALLPAHPGGRVPHSAAARFRPTPASAR